ncbi:L-fucose permease [Melioribacter roseus P3M-2]|uniref:L-fucose permease n=1 Tax=Melioribacter roseus (strain DSM 23840 / JCM 17771 / VKM B-2668 / P3M-2) TaxID=1191523 RepID=I7A0P9_MELRP|nr:L-fucose:H+ symporter permease [Melioribacter roseus]AFN74823.1 L-fucose permease [Melioribacter roseus P3M-2]
MNGESKSKIRSPIVQRKHLIPFILITSCFAWWGLANNMTDTLLAAFKRIMSLSDFQTSWIQIAFYGSYFCLALPAAIFIKKFTYKAGVLLGLGLFITGALLFYPASKTMNYFHFLLALYILAGGLSILETSANPYVIAMGDASTATRRLNLAQSFNPIGSIAGVIISQLFILSHLNSATDVERLSMAPEQLKKIQSAELSAVMGPYVGVAIILLFLWILIAFTKMPRAKDESGHVDVKQTLKRLLRNKNYLLGVSAQFFYVGAQIGVWSFTIRYVMKQLELNEKNAATYYLISLALFALFRFICTVLMKYISPGKLLAYLSGIATVLTIAVIVSGGYAGVIALVSISACMSLMFPTIFGLAVEGLNSDTQIASSGLIMAILGGAILTALQGLVSDLTSNINLAYIIPLFCFIVIFYYGLYVIKRHKKIAIQR